MLAACSNNTKNAKIEEKTINNSEILNQQIIPQIESYYLAKFGKNGINSKQNNDTNFEIFYKEFEIEKNPIIVSISFSKKENDKAYIIQDINNDGALDVLLCVHKEGENGSACRPDAANIFVFLNNTGKYELMQMLDGYTLSKDETASYSFNKLEKGTLYGKAFCFGEKSETECTPNYEYEVTAKFQNNQLIFNNKKLIKIHNEMELLN